MNALVVSSWGATPSVQDIPAPPRPAGSTLLRMLSAGMNPVDLAIGSGRFYGDTPDPPFVLGAEFVGQVVESDTHPVGMHAWVLSGTGGFAEYCVAPDDHLIEVDAAIPPSTAAAFGVAGLAGWMSVRTRGALRDGETVLVLGASGAVGQVAIQTARRFGAGRIVAVSRTSEGVERSIKLGADVTVLTTASQLSDDIAAACAPGADLVIDMLWGGPLEQSLGALAPRARIVQVGNAAATTATIPGGALRGGRIDIRGFSVFTESHDDLRAQFTELVAAAHANTVRLEVEQLPLREAPVAWMRQASGPAGRKLVLVNP